MIKEQVGQAIRKKRLEYPYTFEALAERAEVGITFLKEIEAGKKQPSVTTLFKLARALETTPEELIMPTYREWMRSGT